MKLFGKEKNKFNVSSIKATTTHADGSVATTQIVPAKVIEVGDDEAEGGFSYKYSFINPLNQKMTEATDLLQTISVGEQLFEVGDDVNILVTVEDSNPDTLTVTRQVVFPKVLNKKSRKRKIIGLVYIFFMIVFMLLCCAMAGKAIKEKQEQQTQEEEVILVDPETGEIINN